MSTQLTRAPHHNGNRHGRNTPRSGVSLQQVHPVETSSFGTEDVDIIAIHGLDTNSQDTWVWKDPEKPEEHNVNWLSDANMLPEKVGSKVRIFLCDWPADMFESPDAQHDAIEEFARLLLDGIKRRPPPGNGRGRRTEDQPLLFVASCLGGIVLAKALVMASNEFAFIRTATKGIVFLATPFRSTSFADVARWAEPGMRTWAALGGQKVTPLLRDTKNSFALEELVSGFTELSLQSGYHLQTYYELGETNLYRKAVPWLRLRSGSKRLVDKTSSTLDIVTHPLQTRSHQ